MREARRTSDHTGAAARALYQDFKRKILDRAHDTDLGDSYEEDWTDVLEGNQYGDIR